MKKSWIANIATGANGFCGAMSILMTIEGFFNAAAILLLISMVADFLDGRIARALHTTGPLGVELDSMCDDISFGIAPAALLYASQLRDWGWAAIIPCALLAISTAFRLARFNVRSDEVHGYFEGLPCPMTGMITAGYILSGVVLWPGVTVILILAVAYLMVSSIHYPTNKGATADQLHWQVLAICVALFAILTFLAPSSWFASLCFAFLCFGPGNHWMNYRKKLRKRQARRVKAGDDSTL